MLPHSLGLWEVSTVLEGDSSSLGGRWKWAVIWTAAGVGQESSA